MWGLKGCKMFGDLNKRRLRGLGCCEGMGGKQELKGVWAGGIVEIRDLEKGLKFNYMREQ